MGLGKWDLNSTAMYNTKNEIRSGQSRSEVFKQREVKQEFKPFDITTRESRDSEMNPLSRAIIIALDGSGSMGMLAEDIARNSLSRLVVSIHDLEPVKDPHIMFMSIGDIHYDRAPLQATQFEADVQLSDQIDNLYLEGGGGGNTFESYDLAWIFASNKTSIDCWEKRKEKGYLFTVGDEYPPQQDTKASQIKDCIGVPYQGEVSPDVSLAEAQETYEVFHITIAEGHFAKRIGWEKVNDKWSQLLGKRAIVCHDHKYLVEVIVSAMQVNEGADPAAVVEQWPDGGAKKTVAKAIYGIDNQVAA